MCALETGISLGKYSLAAMKSNWTYYVLIVLTVEKLIQHIVVTFAFLFDWKGISSKVVVPPGVLMILGGIVAILFAVSLWGLLKKQNWTINLLIALAVFDLVGEFVAQGTIAIEMTVSFLMAALLLILSLIYLRQNRKAQGEDKETVNG